jgi:flavin-binding protein dodecin
MSVAKVIEVVGSSADSWEDAVRAAVTEASRTLRGVTGVDVQDWTASVEDGEIVEYKANVKIAFAIDNGEGESGEDDEDADEDEDDG